jgi:3-methylcrotonyl-CoA carboxylase alpha subunit
MSLPNLHKLLVANRGEIAVRILRTCRELGLPSVAVYSEADAHSLHLALADEAVCIGPAPGADSYLSIERIIAAAHATGADALHPGYGFLSENADLAGACERAGITFVGPPEPVMRLLGDKIAAKQLAAEVGVPLVPGYFGGEQSSRRLAREAKAIGAPVLIKAAAGGGGRGMRVAEDLAGFGAAVDEARREARAAFGDDRLLLERYVARPRHVEVQVFGDRHGAVIHLGERECSIQRRHQKILEESPSTALTPELRERITDAAVRLARAAGYVNAGTVEFLLEAQPDVDHAFYFLEVNTRLQVEHPVTEMVTGIDLVRLQLRIAAGEPLPYRQEDIVPRGHALEARIYAEDPAAGFVPSLGRVARWLPPQGPGVRIDSGVETGSEVSPYYDPMLAKLIVRGEDRCECIRRMASALRELHVLGIATNALYLRDIVDDPAFRAGELSTRFLAERFAGWRPPEQPAAKALLALAAFTSSDQPRTATVTAPEGDLFDPWHAPTGWRNA